MLEGVEEQLLEFGRGDFAHVQQVDKQRAEGLQALLAGGAQRDQGQVQRNRGVAADQQAAQLFRLGFIGLDAFALQVGKQLALAQAGAVFLVMAQVQLAGIDEELVAEAAAWSTPGHADHMGAVGQGNFDEDIAGVGGEVELARLFQVVLAEAHVRHARQNRELQGVDRRRLTQVVGAVDRQRLFQREQAEAVAGGVEQGKAANAVTFLGHASSSCSSAMARAMACSSVSSSGLSMAMISSPLSSSSNCGVGSGRALCRLAARSRSCCTDRQTSRKRCIGGRKR